MRRLGKTERKGINKLQLLIWGFAFLLIGTVSRSILQNGVLDMNTVTAEQLLERLTNSSTDMVIASVAIILQAVEACAIPIFAFLVVDGFINTKDGKKLFLYLLGVAVISEIPYNLAMYGEVLHMTTRNPAVALAIGFAVLYFFCRFSESSFANMLIKLFIGIMAVVWVVMLNVEHGLPILIVILTMWALRDKKSSITLFGGAAASGCVIFSPFYIGAALGVLPIHFYKEEEEKEIPLPVYAVYPAMLVIFGVVSIFL